MPRLKNSLPQVEGIMRENCTSSLFGAIATSINWATPSRPHSNDKHKTTAWKCTGVRRLPRRLKTAGHPHTQMLLCVIHSRPRARHKIVPIRKPLWTTHSAAPRTPKLCNAGGRAAPPQNDSDNNNFQSKGGGWISGGEDMRTPKIGCFVYSCKNHSPWDTRRMHKKKFWDTH